MLLTFIKRYYSIHTIKRYLSTSSSSSTIKTSLASSSSLSLNNNNNNNMNQVIIISGATSVGKSTVARELCKNINAEIVLADSVQIYKYMDVGSNKPSNDEMNEIPHHMVDICEPNDSYSGGDFVKQAAPIIMDILKRGKVPVIVGGSTMWIQWLVHGMPDAPKAENIDMNKAEELIGHYEKSGEWKSAVDIVSMYDKTRVEKLGENDWYRLRRYLEVALAVRRLKGKDVNIDSASNDGYSEDELIVTGDRVSVLPGIDIRAFFVSEDREHLYRWIDSRCESMITAGLFEEVTDILLRGKLLPDSIASKAIGYRQTIDYLCREDNTPDDAASFQNFVNKFSSATRNYAKRQLLWYRKDSEFLWLEMTRPGPSLKNSDDIKPYQTVMNEIMHWCSMPYKQYKSVINEQLSRAEAIKTVRAVEFWRRSKDGEKRKFKNKYEKLALEALVANNEIKSEKVTQLLSNIDTSVSSTLSRINDNDSDDEDDDDIESAALGLIDNTIARQKLSALNFFVRAGESLERQKNLKTYRYDSKNQNFASAISRADECVEKLKNSQIRIEFINT